MSAPVPRAVGVWASPLLDHLLVFDAVAGVLHVLNPSAGLVWAAIDGVRTEAQVVAAVAAAVGVPAADLEADVRAGIAELRRSGLVDRTEPPAAPDDVPGIAPTGAHGTPALAVLDRTVQLRSDDPELVAGAAAVLGSLRTDRPVDLVLGLERRPDGAVEVLGLGSSHVLATDADLFEVLPSLLNQVAGASAGCLALHAGAVVHPDGGVVLVAGVSNAGKSTLTAALVQAGWGYLSDEAAGIAPGAGAVLPYAKPLVLDRDSRAVLGLAPSASANTPVAELRPGAVAVGPTSPVRAVLLPAYEPGGPSALDPLAPLEAVVAVAEHALNLRRLGAPGLAILAELVAGVPCYRLRHGGAVAAAASLQVADLG